ncbi:MAG: hypothetical protein Q9157_008568 [Trypethelium eluteriae]
MGTATPKTILRLAAAQSKIFFRPSPHFLVAATARELGHWARRSAANEQDLAQKMEDGIDGLLGLVLAHCTITLGRIRELFSMRFSIMNPVTDIIDQCVGQQWLSTPNFWNGGVDDAYTISADPSETFFHLVIYGELFGPDFEPILSQNHDARRLRVETRLEFIKYCVPDFACQQNGYIDAQDTRLPDGTLDPRRDVKNTGPYRRNDDSGRPDQIYDNNIALTWVIKSSRWKAHWAVIRAQAAPDFDDNFDDGWWYDEDDGEDWRQRLWETVMVCQGLEGLGMIRPGIQDQWVDKIREWKDKVARLDREPHTTKVGRQGTLEYPFLLGDLRICASGYVAGT